MERRILIFGYELTFGRRNADTPERSVHSPQELTKKLVDERRLAGDCAGMGLWHQLNPNSFPMLAEFDFDCLTRLRLGALSSAYEHWGFLGGQFPDIAPAIGNAQVRLYDQIQAIGTYLTERYGSESTNGLKFLPSNDERNAIAMAESLGFYEVITARRFPSLASLPKDEIARMQLRAINNRIEDIAGQTNFVLHDTGFGNGTGSARLASGRRSILEHLYTERIRIATLVILPQATEAAI